MLTLTKPKFSIVPVLSPNTPISEPEVELKVRLEMVFPMPLNMPLNAVVPLPIGAKLFKELALMLVLKKVVTPCTTGITQCL